MKNVEYLAFGAMNVPMLQKINTRLGGFVILSDFHGVSALELGAYSTVTFSGVCKSLLDIS